MTQLAQLVKNSPEIQETLVLFLYSWAFLVAQLVKTPPALQETWV